MGAGASNSVGSRTPLPLRAGEGKRGRSNTIGRRPISFRPLLACIAAVGTLSIASTVHAATRTLSEKGNPRLAPLAAILAAFGLRMAVAPTASHRHHRSRSSDERRVGKGGVSKCEAGG